jgi:hypothetical protein
MQKKSAELVVPSVSWSGAATPLKSNISPSALLRSYPVPLGKAVPDRGDVRVMANVGKPEAIQKRASRKRGLIPPNRLLNRNNFRIAHHSRVLLNYDAKV